MVTSSELAHLVKLIPAECHLCVCDALDLPDPAIVPPSMVSAHLEAGLKIWQAKSPSNRREKLAKALLQNGCYKAALKLDAKCKYVPQNLCNEGVGR